VLLAEQDRSLWDRARIDAGLAALARAAALTERRGPYHLQAAIAACHARAPSVDDTDWSQIASLYGELHRVTLSPVIELNRAIAISRAEGPAAGLAILDDLARHRALAEYHWLPAARADLLEQLGKTKAARREFERAAKLATHDRQRARLLDRAKKLAR
jgi:RNA polymerase sigma-70 factor, ECF subfamily